MQRKAYGRDAGLSARMLVTTFLLGLLYVVFAVVLFNVLNVGLVPMVLIVVGLALFQYFTSDKIALAASGAKVVAPEQAPELHAMVERLCAMADLPKPRVAIIPTDVPNAFATGRSPKHAAVAVTEGLWRRLEPQEIEGVLAHELSHVANRDVLVMTLASFFAMLAALLTRVGLYGGMFGGAEININFPNFLPVHLTYQTAFVDEQGKLQLRDDVYGRDARMIAILKGSERKVADIAIERPPNTSAKPVRMPVGTYGAYGSSDGYYRGGPNFFDFLFGGGPRSSPPARHRYYRPPGPHAGDNGWYSRR